MNGPQPSTAMIEARGIGLRRGGAPILTDFSFTLPRGSLTALIGANGSGKSSLLEAMLGLLPLSAGRLRIGGARAAQARKRAGYVPQTGQRLLADTPLRAREFVAAAYHGERWGIALHAGEVRHHVDWALAQTGGSELAERPIRELSGGQCQRILVAQALVNRPELLLMDEPLAQLDPAAQEQLVAMLRLLCQRHGLTVLLSSHDLAPLLEQVDGVLYLNAGRGWSGDMQALLSDQVLAQLYRVPMRLIQAHHAARHDDGGHRRQRA